MCTSRADRTLAARLRWKARLHTPRRSAAPAKAAVPDARLVQVAAGRADLIFREAHLAPWPSEHSLEEQRQAQPTGRLIVAGAGQALTSLRRGETAPPAGQEMLTGMASQSPVSDTGSDAAGSPDGVSAFIARVLNQLTLSAWLPAAVLTASAAVFLQFRSSKSANVLHAVGELTADPIRVLVITIPLLVIATVVTQAFSFEAIRTLEGYWRRRGIPSIARTLMIRWHVHRNDSINERLHEAYKTALDAGREKMREEGVSDALFKALKESLLEIEDPSPASATEKRELNSLDWRSFCNAWHLAKIDQLLKDGKAYPDEPRILPTKLGNLMRATEDDLENAGDDLEGFVLRYYALASRRVQMQHDQFRDRLEMYCTLAFVSAALVVLALAVLLGSGIGAAAIGIICGSFAALSVASYLAAIASAGGYCAALKEMDKMPDVSNEG
jgi:hypothetical protein